MPLFLGQRLPKNGLNDGTLDQADDAWLRIWLKKSTEKNSILSEKSATKLQIVLETYWRNHQIHCKSIHMEYRSVAVVVADGRSGTMGKRDKDNVGKQES